MEWMTKFITAMKLPIKVLLPAVWMFSGLLIFLPDTFIYKLSLLDWKNNNGFIIGLMFLVSTCLVAIYIIGFIKNKAFNIYYGLTRNRRTLKKIMELSDMESAIIFKMYNSQGYTMTLDFCQPITQGLLARGFIYAGNSQLVSMDIWSNTIPTRFTLQPFIYKSLDYYKPKLNKEINRLKARTSKEKDSDKKNKKLKELENLQELYDVIYNGIL